MTLSEFSPSSVWFTSIGIPAGHMIDFYGIEDEENGGTYDMDPYDIQNAIPFEWDLEGTVNESGEWCWDGEGNPSDWNRNTVLAIKAFRA